MFIIYVLRVIKTRISSEIINRKNVTTNKITFLYVSTVVNIPPLICIRQKQ